MTMSTQASPQLGSDPSVYQQDKSQMIEANLQTCLQIV